ncbi:ZYRO0F08096p [Zygosaccharomyces rouxii]|uniref:ZYRO0F08096p n=1 Tax=Zygosaccharomyces rouxii (strain ATCC 2623 / CBS 732 / NBRC 1130 / NCYC 568 / NRRL Y-229) TaxID=559307 RepID=C5DXV5_ZYGRC|nr:uncharacterized protein ZYRO0F08096g [Zygosaccharomyces rouxii]KAH9199374.1 hypothetical protein LQ764DRAFT_129564 [Zygosaccharomyces rouxii]CAR28616.1 ZYRO0F08096p [Zygosaccharomyces rouxii]
MGYAIAGYPTRKRRGHRHKVKLLKHGKEDKLTNKRRKRDDGKVSIGMSELPVEIIQRIFIMSGNAAMYELNKFYHTILVPSTSLLSSMVWENYVWDPLQYGIELNEEDDDDNRHDGQKVLLMLETVFNVNAFWNYLTANMEILDSISRFIPTAVYQDFMSEGDSGKVVQWWEQDGLMDFPQVFYANFELFVYNRNFIRSLSRFFILKDPYIHLNELIHWFYDRNNNDDDDDDDELFFETVGLVLEIAKVEDGGIYSSEPLESLLDVLFVQNKSNKPIQTFTKFLNLFYSRENAQEHLSDPSLWRLLRSTSNMTVIDIVVNHGGQPHYGAFF